MNQITTLLIDFQIALVQASVSIAVLGVALLGLSMILTVSAPTFAYRLKRLSLQTLGAVLAILILHGLSINYWGGAVPPAVLIGVYGVISLMLFQGLLNLLFGPIVGNSVTAQLLKTLILAIVGLAFASYAGLF